MCKAPSANRKYSENFTLPTDNMCFAIVVQLQKVFAMFFAELDPTTIGDAAAAWPPI